MTDPNILKKPEYSKLISSIKNLYPKRIEEQRSEVDKIRTDEILNEIDNS